MAACLLLALGCTSSTDADLDAGDGEPDAAGIEPTSVAAPVLLPCPPGWREDNALDGVSTCEPWPAEGPMACADDEVQLPGEARCARLGPECPADLLPEGLPADQPVTYVLADATDGDGSASRPYGSLTGFAWGRLRPGAIVALGVGSYEADVRLPPGVTLWGACVAGTHLSTTVAADAEGVVTARGAGTGLRNLTIADSPRPGLWVDGAGVELDAQSVVITGVQALGVHVLEESLLTARELVVRGTRGRAEDGGFGRGLDIEIGATARIARSVIEGNRSSGVFVSGAGATLVLEDAIIRETLGELRDSTNGAGLVAQAGADVDVARSVIEGNREAAVLGRSAGTSLTLEHILIRDTHGRDSDGYFGRGVNVQEGSAAQLTRVFIDRSRDSGVLANQRGSLLLLEDVVVRATLGPEGGDGVGRGLSAQLGAAIEANRVIVAESRGLGVLAYGLGTAIDLVDVEVRDTRPRACAETTCRDEAAGMAIGDFSDATLTALRFAIDDASVCGVQLAHDGEVDLTDGEISRCSIGVCVQNLGYDYERLTNRVRFRSNDVNLQDTDLPVPDPTSPLGR